MLPPYVYDLIAAVQKWEDEHANTDTCFDAVLCGVPKQELDRAAAISHYQRENLRIEDEQQRQNVARRQLSAPDNEPPERAELRRALVDPDSVIVLNGDGSVHEIRELTEAEKNAPVTFHHEPHPQLSGVVRPVLDRSISSDPETGAVEW